MSSQRILYLDQNAWIALARGAWDREKYPREYASLAAVVEEIKSRALIVPLSFANIYETFKINDPLRRQHLAYVQSTISAGRVFRCRRRILLETLRDYLSIHFSLPPQNLLKHWFLSNIWFESAADYSEEIYGFEISDHALSVIEANPNEAIFSYLTMSDESVRMEAIRHYSASSMDLISKIEKRREKVADQPIAIRKRVYGASLLIDEIDFIMVVAKGLGLEWNSIHDIGSSLVKSLITNIPVLNAERELSIRLEDQNRLINENDLRDMMSFVTVIPLADVVVGEKPFVNLARQAGLGAKYQTQLLTSVFDINASIF